MNHRFLSKLIAVAVLAIPAGWAVQEYFVILIQKGQEAYLARARVRWNIFLSH